VTTTAHDLMQEASPLLLPTRPSAQHDDETNQNNAQQKRYVGRKRKIKDKVADATRLLKEQIAKANITSRLTSQSHGPSAFSRHEEQEQSSSLEEQEQSSPLEEEQQLWDEEQQQLWDEEQQRLWDEEQQQFSQHEEGQQFSHHEEQHFPRHEEQHSPRYEEHFPRHEEQHFPHEQQHFPHHEEQPQFPRHMEEQETKIDWGSESEDEEYEERPPPEAVLPRLSPPNVVLKESPGPVSSPVVPPSPTEDEEMEEEVIVPRTISESDVVRLQTEQIANLNGNYDSSGSFHEWHETLLVETYGGEELLILPYTVIDF